MFSAAAQLVTTASVVHSASPITGPREGRSPLLSHGSYFCQTLADQQPAYSFEQYHCHPEQWNPAPTPRDTRSADLPGSSSRK